MDLFHVDRLSKLPDDILYQILSFLNIKYVVQTSTLSKRWMHIWKSVTRLNFDNYKFQNMLQFTRFVNNVLSKRNSSSQVSAVELRFKGPATEFVIESIVNYAYSHSVQKLIFIWYTYEEQDFHFTRVEGPFYPKKEQDFPPYLFTCHTLKHLTLAVYNSSMFAGICNLPESPWDFPALETLNLKNVQFHVCEDKSANLFSKCVNLKELTLHGFTMTPLETETFTICAPQLSSLTIRNAYSFPKIWNVVAPQLKNLTASIQSSLLGDYLQLSAVRFDSLEKVSLSKVYTRYYNHEKLFDLFKKLHSAKFLILDMNIIQMLSSCEDQLQLQPSPFNNLACLRIDARNVKPTPVIPIKVRNYFLGSSSNFTFIMDTPPQVPQKTVKQQVQNVPTAKKRTKLDTENKQLETIDEEKRMLEVEMQRQNEVIAEQKARIRRQDGIIAELNAKIEILEAAKVASSSSGLRTRSKRVIQPSKSSRE
ncbi:F-box domain, cyclin-like protein [Artemisia annua]|uniref:F-box domain, cyclin-like protein n=1 Tax=Artemisia annua TaxID=35608 RepID=A0A2U1LEU1_ARTAN|nr:F-box domain, cyclin-like protein [Artemisia annua]